MIHTTRVEGAPAHMGTAECDDGSVYAVPMDEPRTTEVWRFEFRSIRDNGDHPRWRVWDSRRGDLTFREVAEELRALRKSLALTFVFRARKVATTETDLEILT